MNHSVDEPISGAQRTDEARIDELFGDFEALLYRFVRVIGPRHDEAAGNMLPVPQYMVLRVLHSHGPLRVSDVASHLGVKNPAASMLLHTVTQEGWVARESDPDDRRATIVSISEAGAVRLAAAEEQRRDFMRMVTSKLSEQELSHLVRSLNVILDTVSEMQL